MLNFKTNRWILYVSSGVLLGLFLFAVLRDSSKPVTLDQTQKMLEQGLIKRAVLADEKVYIITDEGTFRIPTVLVDKHMFSKVPVEVGSGNYAIQILMLLTFILISSGFVYKLAFAQKEEDSSKPSSGLPSSGLSEPISPSLSNISFKDVGGIEDVKEELEEIIDFLRSPKKYKNFGAKMPRGVLLVGPPGVGKTMIAKAVAGEADVPFYYQSGASFVQIYVGMGAKRVRELFLQAKQNSPSIIFIDEIDAVGRARGANRNDEREATLNQLLTEMDGFEDSSGVVVIAATNKIEVLDSALLRSGRFDRRIFVDLPNISEREAILNKYFEKMIHKVDTKEIAKMTIGFNGASLATLVNEAALEALRRNRKNISMDEVLAVKDKVIFGKRKVKSYSEDEKKLQALYQAAKALSAYWFEVSFEKFTMINDGLRPYDVDLVSKHKLLSYIKVMLSGMAICEIHYGEHSSNVEQDLKEVKKIVTLVLENYGMGEQIIPSAKDNIYLINKLYAETKEFLSGMQAQIQALQEELITKEQITKEQIKKVMDEVL
ncbi:AAA family ATPase [Sulfurimonas sp. MAG313]|nr:AAA family ATPase [Sulfurimonas sp. MAG313]MDF1881411.1 AAA family ATPase [Sulfurimonas sp. MAG313]